jgi:two-component system, NtrC family, sensor kinase
MPALRSSVLVIGHPQPDAIAFGADFAVDFDAARAALTEFGYPVIALPSSNELVSPALAFLDFVNGASPLSQRVIVQNDTSADGLRRVINAGSVFRILSSFDDERFDLTIQEALDEYRLLQQNAKLLQLVNEQNERLKRLTTELEERVEVRKKSLEEAKERLLVTNHRVEALHRALVAIHRAGSIAEMERLINEALSEALGLTWTRILFQSQARLESQGGAGAKNLSIHNAPLMRGKETLGHIYFARGAETPFTRDEIGFLGQVADAVSLAIDRLTKLEQSETLKHQWEATFDAILDPVSLIGEDHTLVRINRSFAVRSGAEPDKLIGRKCHEALFARTSPCEGCTIGVRDADSMHVSDFRLKPARTVAGEEPNVIYQVFSHEIQFKPDDRGLYVNMYHDVSSQLRYERQILESAKMAELGTIGSSIAHELNNPLGGMLSFLQLIKMDLKGDEPCFDEIDEMEKGARRCRDIVQSLLGFTRKSSPDVVEVLDLRDVISQALAITELQTRAMGITVIQNLPDSGAEVRGQFNSLAQSLRSFLQNAQEAIAERFRQGDREHGVIELKLDENESAFVIEIRDNGAGYDSSIGDQIYDPMYSTKDSVNNPGLSLTVAQQIVRDHGGHVEMDSIKGTGTRAKISLPRAPNEPSTSRF